MTEKLQKILARAGLGSRREMEKWIAAGRVTIDDKLAKLGDRTSKSTDIKVDGKKIELEHKFTRRVLLYNKPLGEVCTRSDEKGRKTVFQNLPKLQYGRWIMVGRLDLNSSGLLLFTNDGELANKLMHPSSELEREYLVRACGEVTPAILQELQQDVMLEDGPAKFKSIRRVNRSDSDAVNQWFKVVITSGRNRLVRRLWQAKKIAVNRLIRIRFCDIILPLSLNSGEFSELKQEDIVKLMALAGLLIKEKQHGSKKKDFGCRQ